MQRLIKFKLRVHFNQLRHQNKNKKNKNKKAQMFRRPNI